MMQQNELDVLDKSEKIWTKGRATSSHFAGPDAGH